MEFVYWVVSRDCNQRCAHCYNDSEPGAPGLTIEDAERCVEHLPAANSGVPVQHVILSGGEVLVWPELLFRTLSKLHERYGDATRLWIQTNGDLLDDATLDKLLDHHVERIDVASQDKFHPKKSRERRDLLESMFKDRGMTSVQDVDLLTAVYPQDGMRLYDFWGANPGTWIGPLWPRGRARKRNLSHAGPEDRFCAMWSGAKNFLNYRDPGSEINIQLGDVYPCCPMTIAPIGSLVEEPLTDILDRCAQHPVFQALNEGDPEKMGEALGITEDEGYKRSRELGNHCLWCDEFFHKYAPELVRMDAITSRKDEMVAESA